MNQLSIGRFICKKRKEKNLTQEQLAEILGVSNKTISKWENGKCMPDYAIVKPLCEQLGITVAELMDGEEADEKSLRLYDEEQILDLLRRTQELEFHRQILFGVILIVMGMASHAISMTTGGSDFRELISGVLLGLSVCEMIAGICYVLKAMVQRKN